MTPRSDVAVVIYARACIDDRRIADFRTHIDDSACRDKNTVSDLGISTDDRGRVDDGRCLKPGTSQAFKERLPHATVSYSDDGVAPVPKQRLQRRHRAENRSRQDAPSGRCWSVIKEREASISTFRGRIGHNASVPAATENEKPPCHIPLPDLSC